MKSRSALALLLLLLPTACAADESDKAMKSIRAADLQRHQMVLASDEYQGREAGTEGGYKAAAYIVAQLAKFGMEPGGEDGTWYQAFGEGVVYEDLAEANVLRLYRDGARKQADHYKLGEAIQPLRGSRTGVVEGTIVFAGYGISAPEYDYDDYGGQKVKGAIVLVLDHEPQEKDPASRWAGDRPTPYSEWSHKAAMAEKHGAAALLIALDPANHEEAAIPKRDELTWPASLGDVKHGIPVVYVSRPAAEEIAKAAGKDLRKVQQEIDRDGKPRSFRVGRPASLAVAYRGRPVKGAKNIVAIRRGSDPKLQDEVIVLGAHYDHVGLGNFGSRTSRAGQVHNGADDNASGTSVLLEIAEALPLVKTKRTVICVWFDGEEKGLLGSREWVSRPTVPFDRVIAMLNLDMVGRNDLRDIKVGVEMTAQGPKYPKFAGVLREAERAFNLKFDWDYIEQEQLTRRSDHWSFMEAGVPAAFFSGGLHADYHTERDDPEKINYPKEELVGRICLWAAVKMAGMEDRLK